MIPCKRTPESGADPSSIPGAVTSKMAESSAGEKTRKTWPNLREKMGKYKGTVQQIAVTDSFSRTVFVHQTEEANMYVK